MFSFTVRRFATSEEPPVPSARKLGGARSWSGRFGEAKIFSFLSGIEPGLLNVTYMWCS